MTMIAGDRRILSPHSLMVCAEKGCQTAANAGGRELNMNQILKTGLWIGVLVVAWTFVMGLTGWYKDPKLMVLFFLVILVEVVLLVLGLRKTAAFQGYGRQVVTGTLMAVVAAVIIFCGSLLFTTVAFPSYFDDLRAMQETTLRAQGKSEQEIAAALEAGAATRRPLVNALGGVAGTVGTGLVASLIIALFQRRK